MAKRKSDLNIMILNTLLVILLTIIQIADSLPKSDSFQPTERNVTFNNYSGLAEEAKPQTRSFVLEKRNESVEVLPEPIKFPSDKKQYKTIKLQNGLVALLISDINNGDKPESSDCKECGRSENTTDGSNKQSSKNGDDKKSGGEKVAVCALSVDVGSYSDPADIQGMAHFVEHMLFMGTKKYPKENDFNSFIEKNGGSFNAETRDEITTFHFKVEDKHVEEALDKFSHFFISPLMELEVMQREREAVESEFAIKSSDDDVRLQQLQSSFFPEGHPNRIFSWGNMKSLKEMVHSDTYLQQQALAFWKRHYSAHRMKVAIQASLDLDKLQQLVINTFGLVPSNNLPPADFTNYTYSPQLITPEFHSLYYMKTINDTIQVDLSWCMKEVHSHYESKSYISVIALLKDTGPGSLLSYLKNKVWALRLVHGAESKSMYSLLRIRILLTQEGFQHLDEVLAATFSYIKMMQTVGPLPDIFELIQTIENTKLHSKQDQQPLDDVIDLADNMQLYPPHHYLVANDLEVLNYMLNMLSPETVNIVVMSKEITYDGKKIQYDATEQWIGTEYKRMEIPSDWKQTWLQIKPYKEFHLPQYSTNIYISTNSDLIPMPFDQKTNEKVSVKTPELKSEEITCNGNATDAKLVTNVIKNNSPFEPVVYKKGASKGCYKYPHLLKKDDKMELWYKPDYKFRLPQAFMYFYFITSLSVTTAKDSCLLDLWLTVLSHDINDESFAANLVHLFNDVSRANKGLVLKTWGPNQNLHLLVDMITKRMRACSSALSPKMFTAIKDLATTNYHNEDLMPTVLAMELRSSLLSKPYYSNLERARALESVTLSELQSFGQRFLDSLYTQILVQGNVREDEARAVADLVQQNIASKGLQEENIPKVVARELPKSVQNCRVSSMKPNDTNSVIINYYQSKMFSWKDNAIIRVLMTLMTEPAYNMLRTKEQLSYIVSCEREYIHGMLGYSITIQTQANKYSGSYVDQRIEAFLESFKKEVLKLDEQELAETKDALIRLNRNVDVDLKDEVSRNWDEIVSMEYTFDCLQREVAAIENITVADLREWIKQHSEGGDNYSKLSIQVEGDSMKRNNESSIAQTDTDGKIISAHDIYFLSNSTSPNGLSKSGKFIQNIQMYTEKLPLFPDITIKLDNYC